MFLIFLLSSALFTHPLALRVDPNTTSYSTKPKTRIDEYDFTGDYPQLQNIEIDAKKKVNVLLLLSGNYPLLEKINIEGGFGTIKGDLTGKFPVIKEIAISCTDANLELNLDAHFEKQCHIVVTALGDITLSLPQHNDLVVIINTSPFGKINYPSSKLEKKKWRLSQKILTSSREMKKEHEITITINSNRGTITLL